MSTVLIEFLVETIQVKNASILYPDLGQTTVETAKEDEEHPLQAILGPLNQSHQSFGRLFFGKESANRTSDCSALLSLEHDKHNMRVFKKDD